MRSRSGIAFSVILPHSRKNHRGAIRSPPFILRLESSLLRTGQLAHSGALLVAIRVPGGLSPTRKLLLSRQCERVSGALGGQDGVTPNLSYRGYPICPVSPRIYFPDAAGAQIRP